MKKLLIVCLMLLFATVANAAETGTQIYCGVWTNSVFDQTNVYCGWWSAINIVSTSPEPQVVLITVYAKGEKHEGEITLEDYGIYATHVQTMMGDFGYDPMVCVGAFTVKIENTEETHSMFLLHNGGHSYSQ